MDFTAIGRLSSYVKTKNLMFAAKYKIRTGQTLTNANGNLVSTGGTVSTTFDKLRDAAKAGNDKAKQAKLRRIKNKLLTGKKLSDEELGFLRVNDPKLYKKAKAADEAREELKEDLKRAKSKSEAREAVTRAMVKASTEAMAELSALGQGGGSALAGGGGGSIMQAGGDAGAMNISGGEVSSAAGDANISGAEAQTSVEGNQAAQSPNVNETGSASNDKHDSQKTLNEKITEANQTQDDDAKTPEDIMEKYLMIIRALEDEWAQFADSKEYKDLPEHTIDDATHNANKKTRRQIDAPNRRILEAAALYRKAMLHHKEDLAT